MLVQHAAVLQSVVSDVEPSQLLPPPDGGGLAHVLVLDFVPVPHVLVQLEYSPHSLHSPLVEQGLALHTIDSNDVPKQLLPPFDGAGFEQALDRDFCPVPHVLVQEEYSAHVVHMPLTKDN